jgi:hypothetical protein
MSAPEDLHAQLAQRLFGWRYEATERLWVAQAGQWPAWDPPAYSTDPVATALVWQWLETRGDILHTVHFDAHCSGAAGARGCILQLGRETVSGHGASWPEALCRAALALAEALEREEGT